MRRTRVSGPDWARASTSDRSARYARGKGSEHVSELLLQQKPLVQRTVDGGDGMPRGLTAHGVDDRIHDPYPAVEGLGQESVPMQHCVSCGTRWKTLSPRLRGPHPARPALHVDVDHRPLQHEHAERAEQRDAAERSPDANCGYEVRGRIPREVPPPASAHQRAGPHGCGEGTRRPSLRHEVRPRHHIHRPSVHQRRAVRRGGAADRRMSGRNRRLWRSGHRANDRRPTFTIQSRRNGGRRPSPGFRGAGRYSPTGGLNYERVEGRRPVAPGAEGSQGRRVRLAGWNL